ncbi:hypothetical protein ACLOJK_000570, partial [Asimina triloba]
MQYRIVSSDDKKGMKNKERERRNTEGIAKSIDVPELRCLGECTEVRRTIVFLFFDEKPLIFFVFILHQSIRPRWDRHFPLLPPFLSLSVSCVSALVFRNPTAKASERGMPARVLLSLLKFCPVLANHTRL